MTTIAPEKSNELIFKYITIYIEIFNNNIDQSDILDEILIKNGARV